MSTFNASYKGIGEMLCAPNMIAMTYRKAMKIKAQAEATAPYDENDKDGIHFRDSFHITAGIREGRTRRACSTVYSDDPHGAIIELGTAKHPAHHTLAKALDAARAE